MASTNRRRFTDGPLNGRLVVGRYERWLVRQPLADKTRVAYRNQVAAFVGWLVESGRDDVVLRDGSARDRAVRDYKRFLSTRRKLKPSSVNQALAAVDSFYRTMPIGGHQVARQRLPAAAPRSLEPDEQRALLRAIDRCPSARDRAIMVVFLQTGLRLSELAALEIDDVALTARRGRVTVRSGKGDTSRVIPLNSVARESLGEWLRAREERVEDLADPHSALWLSRTGNHMTARAIDLVVRRIAGDAGLALSPHVLRHTCVTNLIRSGADVVLVAEIAGHQRLDTTRRYSLPSQADREAAVEAALQAT